MYRPSPVNALYSRGELVVAKIRVRLRGTRGGDIFVLHENMKFKLWQNALVTAVSWCTTTHQSESVQVSLYALLAARPSISLIQHAHHS